MGSHVAFIGCYRLLIELRSFARFRPSVRHVEAATIPRDSVDAARGHERILRRPGGAAGRSGVGRGSSLVQARESVAGDLLCVGEMLLGRLPHDRQAIMGRRWVQVLGDSADQPGDGVLGEAGVAPTKVGNDGVEIVDHRCRPLSGRSSRIEISVKGQPFATVSRHVHGNGARPESVTVVLFRRAMAGRSRHHLDRSLDSWTAPRVHASLMFRASTARATALLIQGRNRASPGHDLASLPMAVRDGMCHRRARAALE